MGLASTLISSIKRAFNAEPIIGSTVRMIDGSGSKGVVDPLFNHAQAAHSFRRWVYAAVTKRNNERSRHALRLMVRKPSGAKLLHPSRRVPKSLEGYYKGDCQNKPSRLAMQKLAGMDADGYEEALDHPAMNLLRQANRFWNGLDLFELRWMFLDLTGNSYLHPIFDRRLGVPVELWPIPSHWVQILPSKTDFIDGYIVGSEKLNERRYELDEILHMKLPNPVDPYYGMGRAEAAWKALGLSDSKMEADTANMQNRGRPDWMAIATEGATQEQLDRLELRLANKLGGTSKSGKPLAVSGKIDLKQLNFPPDVIGDPDRVLDEIAACWDMSRAMLTANVNVAGGGSESALTSFQRSIAADLRRDEEWLNAEYLPMWGIEDDACLVYDNPVPEDKDFNHKQRQDWVASGRVTINEANRMDGLDPVDGGDVPRINGTPLDKVGEQPASSLGGLFTFSHGPDIASMAQASLAAPILQSDKAWGGCSHGAGKAEGEEAVKGKFLASIFTKEGAESDIRDGEPEGPGDQIRMAIQGAFAEMRAQTLALIDLRGEPKRLKLNSRDLLTIEEIYARFQRDIASQVNDPLGKILAEGAAQGLVGVGSRTDLFSVTNPAVAERLRFFSETLANGVTEATARHIRSSLAQGIEQGESIAKLKARVDQAGVFSPARAEAIARSESARAYVQGEVEGWKASGVVSGKKWLLAPNSCPYCKHAESEFNNRAIGLDSPFYEKGSVITPDGERPMKLDYASVHGPPLHPNCRCDVEPVLITDSNR
jgi:hypothetical protein